MQQDTRAIVVVGTTGEAVTLDQLERTLVLRLCVDAVQGKIPVVAGTGTNCTKTTIENTRMALAHGASAALIVTPYYNKPTQEGLYQHYKAIAKAVPQLPIILYNVPSRTGCDLVPETVQRLFQDCPSIVGLKEACGKLERFTKIRELCGLDFKLYSGEDCNSCTDILKGGADGVISVAANVAPKQTSQLCDAALENKSDIACRINATLAPLHHALFLEPNPTGVKYALQHMSIIQGGIRLPLVPLSAANQQELRKALSIATKAEELPDKIKPDLLLLANGTHKIAAARTDQPGIV